MNNKKKPIIGIIMGSDSDYTIMKDACNILKVFEIEYECTIVSAHRTPDRMYKYGKTAINRGLKIIIAGAGGAAHLPGMIASLTLLPVIGVPIKSTILDGQDSLLSIVQMPKGVPVATVAINNSTNAALLAIRILAIYDANINNKMDIFINQQQENIINKITNNKELYDEIF